MEKIFLAEESLSTKGSKEKPESINNNNKMRS